MPIDGPATRGRGRPKDPLLEDRILHAAAQVYGRHGWAGFTFDAVAREAGVGKSTLYARWAEAADLLACLIERRWQALEAIDSGRLDSDLLAFARFVLARYAETGGGIPWHLRRDIRMVPQLAAKVGSALDRTSELCIDILRRARSRGELREGVSLSLATEMLLAALENHAMRRGLGGNAGPADDVAHVARIFDVLCDGIVQR